MAKKKSKERKAEAGAEAPKKRISAKEFDKELENLQVELCKLQSWVVKEGLRVVIVFEGRDAAGKGGVIKRITERVSPRVFRVAALPAPTEREKTQLYMQRYLPHFPAAGEVVLFDRIGTTGPVWSASWASAPTSSTNAFCASVPCSSGRSSRTASS